MKKEAVGGCFYDEKTADDLFKELGYTYIDRLKNGVEYFDEEDESIGLFDYESCGKRITHSRFEGISMQELQAINKKCEEMRMDLIKKWKEIKGFEGKYIISNYGEIISLPRFKQNNSKLQYVEPKEICKYINKKNGYVYVFLCNDGKDKNFRLHRIVAETFLENSNNLPQVNHKDGDKTNNRVDNLEWCTASHNLLHAYKLGLANNDKRKIKIGQYSMDGKLLKTFNSLTEASKLTGVNIQKISLCINNKYKYRNRREKYIWRKN